MIKLLSKPDSNMKVAKNEKLGVLTAPLHLAPFDLSGHQVCPKASQGCAAACLHTAGIPWMQKAKDAARIARTKWLFQDRKAYLSALHNEIAAHERAAAKQNMAAAVRLNATSDIAYERMARGIFDAFPDVQFYDYTKIANRFFGKALPANYHLTFSASENNEADVLKVLHSGNNVAMVFSTTRTKELPLFWKLDGIHWPVVDGDETDYRPLDPRPAIIGLRAKGKARKDFSGFVRHV